MSSSSCRAQPGAPRPCPSVSQVTTHALKAASEALLPAPWKERQASPRPSSALWLALQQSRSPAESRVETIKLSRKSP